MDAHAVHALKGAQTLDDVGTGLLDHIDVADHQQDEDQHDDGTNDERTHNSYLLSDNTVTR